MKKIKSCNQCPFFMEKQIGTKSKKIICICRAPSMINKETDFTMKCGIFPTPPEKCPLRKESILIELETK